MDRALPIRRVILFGSQARGDALVPITPQRLEEKKAVGDHFFHTVLTEGDSLSAED